MTVRARPQSLPDPVCELLRVRYGRREQDDVDMIGEHNDHFLPHDASLGDKNYQPLSSLKKAIATYLGIIDVMHFIKNNKLDISDEIRSFIQHTPENFRSHDQTWGFRINLYISCENSDSGRGGRSAGEGRFEVAEFLVRESFDRGCVDCTERGQ